MLKWHSPVHKEPSSLIWQNANSYWCLLVNICKKSTNRRLKHTGVYYFNLRMNIKVVLVFSRSVGVFLNVILSSPVGFSHVCLFNSRLRANIMGNLISNPIGNLLGDLIVYLNCDLMHKRGLRKPSKLI